MSRVLIAGCGYVGSRLAELLMEDDDDVWGLRRDPSSLPDRVRPVAADVTDPSSLAGLPEGLDGVVYAVTFAVDAGAAAGAGLGLIVHEFPEAVICFLLLQRAGVGDRTAFIGAFAAAGGNGDRLFAAQQIQLNRRPR